MATPPAYVPMEESEINAIVRDVFDCGIRARIVDGLLTCSGPEGLTHKQEALWCRLESAWREDPRSVEEALTRRAVRSEKPVGADAQRTRER
jgi:hypothetical protein